MWIEYLRIALGVLRAHKFRSLLTVASITIGAFSIVLMTSWPTPVCPRWPPASRRSAGRG